MKKWIFALQNQKTLISGAGRGIIISKLYSIFLKNPDNDQFFFGTFHMSGQGEATWAELAQNTFEEARLLGSKYVSVRRISTEEYPTPADRPKNSRLDNAKLKETFGFSLPSWKLSLKTCVKHLLEK